RISTIPSFSTRIEIGHRSPVPEIAWPVVGFGYLLDDGIPLVEQRLHVASQKQNLRQASESRDWRGEAKYILHLCFFVRQGTKDMIVLHEPEDAGHHRVLERQWPVH